MVIWRVATPVLGSPHNYTYRLFYGRPGERLIGYDNEHPKGDHRHLEDRETRYEFVDVDTPVREFLADVEREQFGPRLDSQAAAPALAIV